MKKLAIAACMMMISFPLLADKKLSGEDVKNLVSGKSWEGYNAKTKKNFTVYATQDGTHTVKYPDGKVVKGTWKINESGQHCVDLPHHKGCADVWDVGNGNYERRKGKEVVNKWKNFKEGNN